MKTFGKFSKIAISAAIAGALVLPASAAFAGDRKSNKTERAILGAVLGGAAGAMLGDGDGGAIAVGALAGGALGAATATDKRHHRYSSRYDNRRPYYSDNRYGYDRYDRRDNRRYQGDRYNTGYDYYGQRR
ncbi:hypothetical protein V7S57_15415 [Caulobacter sp. CCNWLY153]|jgi:peroxin-13|uniref:17 kDa surface antigen n=1 Tax=Caulobacter radicis TaxID=2172650 RepID=A0A2T9IXY1_9CAUL|nr:hypothetical protein [Caulobacter radicis]PVM71951.1 hypothetical protein DDF65_22925 [Caulobacter radicis]